MKKNKWTSSLFGGVLFSAILLFSGTIMAQKKAFLTEQEEIIEAAYLALDNSLKEGGELHAYKTKYGLTGSYTFNITIREKGEVATVSVVEGNGEIKYQNQLKDYLKEMKFPFKMPKGNSYKFKYQFNL